jgi:F-type H+-transporting ATPase subunit b
MHAVVLFVLAALSIALPNTAWAAAQGGGLLSVSPGLIIWTIVCFGVLYFVLSRYAFPPIVAAVQAREAALEEAIAAAQREREEASTLLAEQRRQLEAARGEADKLILEGRSAGEKLRAVMVEETRQQQQEMLERARREISNEKERAIMELRREAVDLAIASASKVIEKNLDSDSNRRLVESYLASIERPRAKA